METPKRFLLQEKDMEKGIQWEKKERKTMIFTDIERLASFLFGFPGFGCRSGPIGGLGLGLDVLGLVQNQNGSVHRPKKGLRLSFVDPSVFGTGPVDVDAFVAGIVPKG